MKSTIIKWATPLTIISMFVLTKWWFAIPVDGPDKLFWGFPFAFIGEGFHASMSIQFFILEFIADAGVYFLSWILLCYYISKIFSRIRISKHILPITWSVAILFVMAFLVFVATSNTLFKANRNFDWKLLKTGYVLFGKKVPDQIY